MMKNLKKLFIASLISIFTVKSAYADSPIERQELFLRAHKSIAFIVAMSFYDESFKKTLSPDELKMLIKVGEITTEMNSVAWLQRNKVQRFDFKSQYLYAYTVFKNEVIQLTTPINRPIQIQFSDDQSLFTLNASEPVRSAMTETALEKDIFVNLNKINDRNQNYDLGSAISILFHEYGHKLASLKNQDAINSCAAKLENYVRAMTNTTEVNGLKINTLIFKNFNFPSWVERILVGENVGAGKPLQRHALTVVDKEGIYAWVQDSKKIVDLTDAITQELYSKTTVKHTPVSGYHFLSQSISSNMDLKVQPINDGNFKFAFTGISFQVVIPFMTNNSPRPDEYKLYLKAFPSSPWTQDPVAREFTFNQNNYNLKKAKKSVLRFENPDIRIEFLDKKLKGNNLEIYYSIKGQLHVPATPIAPALNFWPEITIQINGVPVTLKATNYYPDENEYKFVLQNFDKISDKEIKITKMQFKLDSQNIVQSGTDGALEGFLTSETVLSKKKTGAATVVLPPVLKSMQLWNGTNWVSLRGRVKYQKGTLIRLAFKSSEPLRELNLTQDYSYSNRAETFEPGRPVKTDIVRSVEESRSLRFTEQTMRQTVIGEFVYVDINIDQGVKTSYRIDHNPMADEWFHQNSETAMPRLDPKLVINYKTEIDPLRKLSDISAVTVSGASLNIDLKNALSFEKIIGDQAPDKNSLRFKKMKCEGLF